MVALMIALSIIAFLVVITVIPMYVEITFKEELQIKLRYLFFKFNLFKDTKKKANKGDEKEEQSKSKSIRDTFKDQGLNGIIGLIKEISRLALGILRRLFSHIIIDDLNMNFIIVGNDAADTAVKYGYACATIFPSLNIIMNIANCKRRTVKIKPGFDENESEIEFLIKFHIKPIFAISTLIIAAFKYIKWVIKTKLKESN